VLYLWGHLTAAHDSMLPLLGLRERLHPEFDVAFISNPDRSRADIPSHEEVRGAWTLQHQCEGNAVHGAKGLTATE
jgi:hypothetical protein